MMGLVCLLFCKLYTTENGPIGYDCKKLIVHLWTCMVKGMSVVHVYVACIHADGEGRRCSEGFRAPCSCTSGLYIKPLINPEWRPGSDRMTGPAPVQDGTWFITTELQPALIYFRRRKGESRGVVFRGDGHRNSTVTLGRETWSDPERCNTGSENKREELAQFKSRICIMLSSRAGNKEKGSHAISDGGRGRDDESWKLVSIRWVMFPPRHVLSVRVTPLALSPLTGGL